MLSIKEFLDHPPPDVARRIVPILLHGIAIHSFAHNAQETANFQNELRRIRMDFEKTPDPDTALLLVGAAVRCLEEHNASAECFLQAERQHQQNVISLLTESLLKVSRGSEQAAGDLKRIESEMRTPLDAGDYATLRQRLERCLYTICREAERHQEQKMALTGELRRAAKMQQRLANATGKIDPVTGLPGEDDGTRAVQEACQSERRTWAVAFAAERMETINLRFGFKVGDQILLLLAQQLAQSLQPDDLLFRWRGPCFLVLLDRSGPEPAVAAEIKRIFGAKLEHTLTMGTREVVVPVTGSWAVFPLSAGDDAEDVLRRVSEFAVRRV
jgi:GGDEF domain-containing protein